MIRLSPPDRQGNHKLFWSKKKPATFPCGLSFGRNAQGGLRSKSYLAAMAETRTGPKPRQSAPQLFSHFRIFNCCISETDGLMFVHGRNKPRGTEMALKITVKTVQTSRGGRQIRGYVGGRIAAHFSSSAEAIQWAAAKWDAHDATHTIELVRLA
jgi:hypothetical protein